MIYNSYQTKEGFMTSGTEISKCGLYQYFLTRHWFHGLPKVTFIMLNPSTVDHIKDDATIKHIMEFAQSNGFGGINVINLYALRVTDSNVLFNLGIDPVGEKNNEWIVNNLKGTVICGWGTKGKKSRVNWLIDQAERLQVDLWCLGFNDDDSPKHPLYLSKNARVQQWLR